MATDVIVRVVPGGLMCVNALESEKLDRLQGREIQAKLSMPRNLAFHRKLFALLEVGRSMSDTDFNSEQYRAICITGSGHCDFVEFDGKMVAVPRSIAFANMDETEFSRLYEDVLTFICSNWAVDEETINKILEFM